MAEQLRVSGITASLAFEQKVIVHAFAWQAEGPRLLVFDHRDAPAAGTQVPAGSVNPGESPTAAALRELKEETGLEKARVLALSGPYLVHLARGGLVMRHIAAVALDGAPGEPWEHIVSGRGEDSGMCFRCFWTDARNPVPLATDFADHLSDSLARFLQAGATQG